MHRILNYNAAFEIYRARVAGCSFEELAEIYGTTDVVICLVLKHHLKRILSYPSTPQNQEPA